MCVCVCIHIFYQPAPPYRDINSTDYIESNDILNIKADINFEKQ